MTSATAAPQGDGSFGNSGRQGFRAETYLDPEGWSR